MMRLIATIALAGVAALGLASGAQAAKGKCEPAHAKYQATKAAVSTNSQSFVEVPGSKFKFKQGGNKSKCVRVEISSMVGTDSDESLILIAKLDGGAQRALPGKVQMVFDIPAPVQRAATFIFPSVAPGAHTVQLYYQSNKGGIVGLFGRVVTLEHY